MRIWQGYGSEHSANLVIIGEFKSDGDAVAAEQLIERAAALAYQAQTDGQVTAGSPSERMPESLRDYLFRDNSVGTVGPVDVDQLLYEHDIRREGANVIVTTEESDVAVFLKLMLSKQAKVQVYSAHAHPSDYGRQTYGAD